MGMGGRQVIAVEVRLWNTTIGALTLREGDSFASFEYAAEFLESGMEPAPVMMPLAPGVYRFPELPLKSFHGLPGMFADAVPDKFGNTLIDAWLAEQGRAKENFSALERLCYTGTRAMGALEFYPVAGPETRRSESLDIERLRSLADKILVQRKRARVKIKKDEKECFEQILRVGTSAGGARAKALVAYNERTGELRSGQVNASEGFTYWLLKLDGVGGNGDKEDADAAGYGAVEYAYSLMARAAGIGMTPCRLFEIAGKRHFMTKRFDRTDDDRKLHYQSFAGLCHFDFNAVGAYSYEQAFAVTRKLGLGASAREALFRRAVFNILARNQDDHVKNIGFLMDKSGTWSLAPAFDMTYAYNPGGLWTGRHQMSLNGKLENFAAADFAVAARSAGLPRGRYKVILEQVLDAVALWSKFAKEAGVEKIFVDGVRKGFPKFR
jgi:serine/threonine-protein kinase HipA